MTYKATRICCYIGYITQAVIINFAPLLFVIFQKSFDISYALIGTLILMSFLTQMSVDIISVFFVDKIGFKKSAVISQSLSAAGLILLPILAYASPNPFLGICVATIIYSVGAGLIEVVINPILAALPGEENGIVFLHSFYSWGQLIVVLFTTAAIKIFGSESWIYLSPIWGIIPLINAFGFAFSPFAPQVAEEKREKIGRLLKNKTFIYILLIMICTGGSELAMAQWASTFAQNALGVDKLVGDLFGPCLFALFMGLGRTVYGVFGDRINIEKHMYINAALCLLCYLTAVFSKNAYIALAGCSLCGYSISIMWPGIVSLASKIFPNGSGSMYSAIAIFGDIGCSIAPFFTGVVASMNIWGDNGLKAGMLINIIYPIFFMFLYKKLKK